MFLHTDARTWGPVGVGCKLLDLLEGVLVGFQTHVYVNMCIDMYVYVYMYMHIYICTYAYTYIYVHMCIYMCRYYTYKYNIYTLHILVYIHMYIYMNFYIYIYRERGRVCVYICRLCLLVHFSIYVFMYVLMRYSYLKLPGNTSDLLPDSLSPVVLTARPNLDAKFEIQNGTIAGPAASPAPHDSLPAPLPLPTLRHATRICRKGTGRAERAWPRCPGTPPEIQIRKEFLRQSELVFQDSLPAPDAHDADKTPGSKEQHEQFHHGRMPISIRKPMPVYDLPGTSG